MGQFRKIIPSAAVYDLDNFQIFFLLLCPDSLIRKNCLWWGEFCVTAVAICKNV